MSGGNGNGSGRATVLVATGAREKPAPYLEALATAGLPRQSLRVVTPGLGSPDEAAHLAASAAGLLLCGGGDLQPRHYGEAEIPEAHLTMEEERDGLELALLAGAREGCTPVFGVCRGLQVLNVFLGGTLWQDLAHQLAGSLLHRQEHPKDALVHPVRVLTDATPLGETLAREAPLVNSRHHQGIRRLGDNLTVVGEAPDGLAEAISFRGDDWWAHAVQWHPENLTPMAQGRALWETFAAAVRRAAGGAEDAGRPS